MNSASSAMAGVTDRIASIEARFGTRPPVSSSALAALTSGGSSRSRDANASFGQLVDRLVSSSASREPSDAGSALADVLEQVLATRGSAPIDTRGAVTTVEGSPERPAASTSADGQRIVDLAAEHLGVPYVWGGEDPTGFDCSGLVQFVYAKLGIDLPRVSRDQARVGQEIPSLDHAVPGDLVVFGTPVDHIGIYAGNGQMVVAPKTGDVVKIQQIRREPVTIRRVLDVAPASMASDVPASTPVAPVDQPYLSLFSDAESRHGVSAELLQAVAKQESGFNPNAVSPAGAQGLMQLMPATAKALGVDPFDPTAAVDGSARLLSQHLRRFGSVPLALAAYNAGPGAVEKFGGIPPYKETQGYVRKIMADLADGGGTMSAPAIQRLVDQPTHIRRGTPLFDRSVANSGSTARLATTSLAALSSLPSVAAAPTSIPPMAPTATSALLLSTPVPASTATATATATGPVATVAVPPAATTPPVFTVPSPSMVPATVIGTPGFTLPEGKPVSPAKGAWGPNTQTQVTSVGGSNTTSWLESGLLDPAAPADVAAIVASAKGPVAKGVLKILQNATAAQMVSPEFRQTLNDVNRDALGLPDAPDVISVQPPAPVAPTAAAPSTPLPASPTPVPGAPAPATAPAPLARPIVATTTAK